MVTITLDRERRLLFGVGAARWFKQAYGKPLPVVLTGGSDLGPELIVDTDCLCHALAAALRHEDPGITVAKVEQLLDAHLTQPGALRVVWDKILDALKESPLLPRDDDTGKAPAS